MWRQAHLFMHAHNIDDTHAIDAAPGPGTAPTPPEPYKIQSNLFTHAYDTDVTHVLMLAPALGQVLHPKRAKCKQICSRKHMTLMKHMHLTLDLALGQVHYPHHTKYISKSVHART